MESLTSLDLVDGYKEHLFVLCSSVQYHIEIHSSPHGCLIGILKLTIWERKKKNQLLISLPPTNLFGPSLSHYHKCSHHSPITG